MTHPQRRATRPTGSPGPADETASAPRNVRRTWRLNERLAESGARVRDEVGDEQLLHWRRSWDVPPPAEQNTRRCWEREARYRRLGIPVPSAEPLEDVHARLIPYWEAAIIPNLRASRTVLIVAHGNALRALIKHLDDLPDDTVGKVRIPTGMSLEYRLDSSLRPLVPGGSSPSLLFESRR
ncbi:2,3-bisphosphoglycerate-dependent phosphoglycerate mutase [Streptomyces sp. NPDC056983]|uniref:2,3-bisphosphoglycerate-dependent phosphoglycerate mutase n=1 Tax=Streptomyces sp. NPDC056983 TaxID=3345987 RepID=UPI003636C05B